MMKKLLMSAAFSCAIAQGALAGDTVTITAPGGAGQTIGPGVIAAAITRATGVTVTSVTPRAGGDFTVVAGGNTYIVTSGFVATLLAYYS